MVSESLGDWRAEIAIEKETGGDRGAGDAVEGVGGRLLVMDCLWVGISGGELERGLWWGDGGGMGEADMDGMDIGRGFAGWVVEGVEGV